MILRGQFSGEPENAKKAILSVGKPSYTLVSGFKKVRAEHRERLNDILFKLIRQQNWAEASGVESVLLRATCKNHSLEENLVKYNTTMELLKHIGAGQVDFAKVKQIYEIWMRKNGSSKLSLGLDKFAVQMKFIVFCLTEGNTREAHQAALCLMQEREFGRDSVSNMIVGLTFYQLWYSTIPMELQLRDFKECFSPILLTMADTKLMNAEVSSESPYSDVCDSITSVMDKRGIPRNMSPHSRSQDARSQKVNDLKGFYANQSDHSGEENILPSNYDENLVYTSMLSGKRWELWLLPLQLDNLRESFEHFISLHKEMFNDYYYNAVKYLRNALQSTPPSLDALLPFIQLLILKGDVKEVLEELEKLCLVPNWVTPSRVRARIVENLHGNSPMLLCDAFEDTLKRDPTCLYPLSQLIRIHEDGSYSTSSLVEMIGLHLDATHAGYNIWKHFATCLLGLSRCEEDMMSACCHERRIPTQGKSGREWRNRCRWWTTRHFSKHVLASEVASHNWQLITYKAASAAHLYGKMFFYVTEALDKGIQGQGLQVFLETHILNSLGPYPDAL